ncbi:response regulator [Rubrivirga sp. IMCC43871]|uniref:response regulator n=1 Tax=Rubrivirga sp. IMCC43871 TaxID=3391575 RepID=UPI0039900944
MPPPARLFLVEDHSWLLATLTQLLDREPGLTVCGTAASVAETLARIPPDTDIVLVDLSLPDGSGLDIVRALAERQPQTVSLVLSARPSAEVAARALDAGAAAYVEKGDIESLLATIHAHRPS